MLSIYSKKLTFKVLSSSTQGSQGWRIGATAIHEAIHPELSLSVILRASVSAQYLFIVVSIHDELDFNYTFDGALHALLKGLNAETFLGSWFEPHTAYEI